MITRTIQNPQFVGSNYALMRHAHVIVSTDEKNGGETIINPESKKICCRVVFEFGARIRGKNVSIFHSPITRAMLTAKAVEEMLQLLEINVVKILPLPGLSVNEKIDNALLQSHLPGGEDDFVLFISHEPNIKNFLDVYHVNHCALYAREFTITGFK